MYSFPSPSHGIAPVGRRATPYVMEPQQCFFDSSVGAITCLSQQSVGGLHARGAHTLPQVYTNGPVGPWTLVGYVRDPSPQTPVVGGTRMLLYCQRCSASRSRYNYRVTDTNEVPVDVSENSMWLTDGATVDIEGVSVVVHLYRQYRCGGAIV